MSALVRIFHVELAGESREVYEVEAVDEDDARANWSSGALVISEAFGMDVESVREITEDAS